MSMTAGTRRVAGSCWIVACGFLCSAGFVHGAELEAERSFFQEYPQLQFLEQRLEPMTTLAIPPDAAAGHHVATDLELRAAFSRVFGEYLAPPSTFASKAGGLVAEVCRYRPAQAAEWASVAVAHLLARSLPDVEREVGAAVATAVAVNPAQAAVVVNRAIEAIVKAVDTRAISVEAAGRVAGEVVLATMRVVASSPDAGRLLGAVAEESLRSALDRDAPYLVIEIMSASVAGAKDRTPLGEICQTAFARFGKTKDLTGLIAVGALKAAGVEATSVVKDQAALSLSVPVAAFAVVVCNAYVNALSAPEATALVPRLLPLPAAEFVAAVMIGTIGAHPEEAAAILRTGLDRDLVLHGKVTTREIVEAAILACGWKAPELAAAAVGHGDPTEGSAPAQIAEAVTRAAPGPLLLAALNAQMQAEPVDSDAAKAIASGAIGGAVAAQRLPMVGAITRTIAAGTQLAGEVLDQAVISAPPELQYAAALGPIAADREHAAALLERATHHHDLAAGQSGPLAAGGGLIVEIQRNPLAFFHAAASRLLADSSPEVARAIVLGSALANPRGASAVAAAAAATTDLAPEILVTAASQGDRSAAATIAAAVGAARHVKLGTADLPTFLRRQITADPDSSPELVTGCTAVAPTLSDVIAEAAIRAAPERIGEVVPRTFAFSLVRNPLVSRAEPVGVKLAELTDGAMRGMLASCRDAESAERGCVEVTAAVVKSALALTRDPALASSRDAALAAVVTAAARAAGEHAIAIARTAALTARVVLHEEADGGKIRAAVLAANPPAATAAKITDAIGAGFAEADSRIPAPNAKALLDYAHDALTGTPMTSFRDL